MQGNHLSLGFTVAGASIPLVCWIAEQAGVKLPDWLLIPLGVVAAGMFFGGVALICIGTRNGRGGSLGEVLGLHRDECRRLAEEELRQIANEHPVVNSPLRVFDRAAQDTPDQWMAAAREFIEAVQGPAAEALFTHANDPQDAAIQIARALDLHRLPSRRAMKVAIESRRAASGLYPAGATPMVVPAWSLRTAPTPASGQGGLARQLDDLLRGGMELLDEVSAPVEPEKTGDGEWRIDGGPPDGWWEKVDAFERGIRDLLRGENPALLSVFGKGHNDHLQAERESNAAEDEPDPNEDKRSTAEKMLDFANFSRSGPARKTEALLEGLAAARLRLTESDV